MTEVTFIPVFLAGFASAIIGALWYSPFLFGNIWMRMTSIIPEQVERGKKRMWLMAIFALLGSMLAAYVMDYFGIAWQVSDWLGALQLGFWCWAGFSFPIMLNTVLWEQKPIKSFLINACYWLIAFIVMALVLVYSSALITANQYNAPDGSSYTSGE